MEARDLKSQRQMAREMPKPSSSPLRVTGAPGTSPCFQSTAKTASVSMPADCSGRATVKEELN